MQSLSLRYSLGNNAPRLRLPTGKDIILPRDSFFGRDVYVTNADVDWGGEALFCSYLEPSWDLVDVGANIGYYSNYAAPLVRRVFSFEPDCRNHAALTANAALAGNVHIQEAALSSQAGEASLDISTHPTLSKLTRNPGTASQTTTVRLLTLDGFAKEQPDLRVTGLKIDTEGHEMEILRGSRQTILRDQPLILAELMRWPGQGGESEFLLFAEFASGLGYSLFGFTPAGTGLLRRGKFRLLHFDTPAVFSAHATKMIFLVPSRLRAAFDAECLRRCGRT